jgi:tetratricopeptide (TPR) repeat protein
MLFTGKLGRRFQGRHGTKPMSLNRPDYCRLGGASSDARRRISPPGGFRAARGAASALLALCLLLAAGCSSTPKRQVVITGNPLVDGPEAISHGPPRDRVLWQYRTAAAAMRQGDFEVAKRHLDEAITTLQGIYSANPDARKARGYFHAESKKTFIGEPYERSMAYIYRGILYWMDGEPDNARACFRSAQLEDSDAENREYAGDWVMADYLDGLASLKLGGDGADALKRAEAAAKALKLPPYNPKAQVIFFFEFGPGPTKFASGEYGEQLRFHAIPSPVRSCAVKVGSLDIPVAPTDDVVYQATTRGGRVMDHILGNKAVFKSATDTAGNVALIGGLGTAAFSHDRTAQQIGLGIALAGLVSKAISAATTPAADVRAWDNLPHYLSFACVPLPPGPHTATVEFKDAAGNAMTGKTKTVTFEVPADGKDKVIFISDQSPTPQKI